MVDEIEMSNVAANITAVAAFWAADTTDVLSAAKAADSGFCPAVTLKGLAEIMVHGLIGHLTASNRVLTSSPGRELRGGADYGIGLGPNIQKCTNTFGDPAGSGGIFWTFSKIVRNGSPGPWRYYLGSGEVGGMAGGPLL